MSSSYDNDPRVTDMGGMWEIHELGGVSGTVVARDGGWAADVDGAPDSGLHIWPTANDAIESMIGAPLPPPNPGDALREIENM